MSIYVSVCCLGEDKELVETIRNCKQRAKHSNNIYFGIAVIGNIEFYKKIKKELSNIKNISYLYKKTKNNLGVGKGRNLASSMYNGEDYFLQIDAHSRFSKDWDTTLIDNLNEAIGHVNNKKTVLTGYLGEYFYDKDSSKIYITKDLGYNVWLPNEFLVDGVIPKWTFTPLHSVSNELNIFLKSNKFAPANKIAAGFIFGNSYFGENIHLPENLLFWEEEIIQTIELIDDGFSILHFGDISPVYHLYAKNIFFKENSRETLSDFLPNDKETGELVKDTFLSYLKNNYLKVKKFEKYAKIDLILGTKKTNTFPETYSNVGFLPLKI